MFYDEALVTDVSGGLYIPKDPGIWYFTLELESPERVLPAAESCLKILAASQQSELSRQDLDRVRVSLESEKVYATQSVDGLASRLGFLRMALGDLEHDQEYLEKIRSLDPEEVQSVASKYLTQDRLQVTLMLPKKSISQASELREWERKLQSVVAAHLPTKNPKAAPTPSKKQTKGALVPEQWTLPSGARVVFVEREQSEVFSIHTTMLGGLRGEWQTSSEHPEEILGASHLLSQTWTKGAGSLDSRAIAHEIESRAAGLDGYSGRHSLGLQLVGLSRDFEPLSQVLSTCLLEPTLPEEELEHSRRVTLDSLKSMEDHSGQLCSRLFLETLFEHHPYRYSTLGTLGSVPKLTREKLLKLYQAWLRPEELVVSISGKVSRRRLDHWLLSLDEKLQQQKTSSPERSSLRVRALSDEPALKGPRWAERKLGREQIHILVGGLGIRLTDVEKYSLRLLQNILGGQSGRMFIELREKRSLAYSVAPTAFEGMEKGYVGTYIACSPSKREEATQGIRKVLEEFARKGPTEAELKRAREYYLGKRVMDLQGDSSLAQSMGLDVLYGLPIKTAAMARKELEKVRTSDLQRFCQKYFLDAPQVTSVVG
jgi:zinc protease